MDISLGSPSTEPLHSSEEAEATQEPAKASASGAKSTAPSDHAEVPEELQLWASAYKDFAEENTDAQKPPTQPHGTDGPPQSATAGQPPKLRQLAGQRSSPERRDSQSSSSDTDFVPDPTSVPANWDDVHKIDGTAPGAGARLAALQAADPRALALSGNPSLGQAPNAGKSTPLRSQTTASGSGRTSRQFPGSGSLGARVSRFFSRPSGESSQVKDASQPATSNTLRSLRSARSSVTKLFRRPTNGLAGPQPSTRTPDPATPDLLRDSHIPAENQAPQPSSGNLSPQNPQDAKPAFLNQDPYSSASKLKTIRRLASKGSFRSTISRSGTSASLRSGVLPETPENEPVAPTFIRTTTIEREEAAEVIANDPSTETEAFPGSAWNEIYNRQS